jgi:uncharacterized membrane protein (DUF485 family)
MKIAGPSGDPASGTLLAIVHQAITEEDVMTTHLDMPAPFEEPLRSVDGPAFRRLLANKRRIIIPLLSVFLLVFLSAMGVAGYARPLLAESLFGSYSLGYALVVGLYCLCWATAICYVSVAPLWFDRPAQEAIDEMKAGERRP